MGGQRLLPCPALAFSCLAGFVPVLPFATSGFHEGVKYTRSVRCCRDRSKASVTKASVCGRRLRLPQDSFILWVCRGSIMLSCFLMVHLGHELSEFRIELHCPGTAGR